MTENFYKTSHGVVIVFDVTNENSFVNLKFWLESLKKNADPSICKIMCGNKTDKEDRVISREDAEKLANENEMKYYDVSAKNGDNI